MRTHPHPQEGERYERARHSTVRGAHACSRIQTTAVTGGGHWLRSRLRPIAAERICGHTLAAAVGPRQSGGSGGGAKGGLRMFVSDSSPSPTDRALTSDGSGEPGRGLVYLNCPRCRLSIRSKPNRLTVEHCPRCIARSRIAVRLFASTLSAEELYAAGSVYAAGSAPEPDRAEARATVGLRVPRA